MNSMNSNYLNIFDFKTYRIAWNSIDFITLDIISTILFSLFMVISDFYY